jgi:quinol monooxygenase YgiN
MNNMIIVLASIKVKPGTRASFIEIFNANIPNVLAEDGCIEYAPTVDIATGLPPQQLDENIVTIVEKWASVEALQAHLVAPHMLSYKEQVKDIVLDVGLKVLQPA